LAIYPPFLSSSLTLRLDYFLGGMLNVIERSFKEVKRRTRVVGRFPNETSALVMVFIILSEERLKWQKIRMKADDIAWIEEASKALEQEPIRLEFLEETLVA